MRFGLFSGCILFFAVCCYSLFGHSQDAVRRAEAHFTADTIAHNAQFAWERRALFWAGALVELGFLVVLVFTKLGRRIADGCQFLNGGLWLPAVLLVGVFFFVAEILLRFPINVARFLHSTAWGMTSRPMEDWLLDYSKSVGVSAAIGAIVLVGLFLLLRWLPRLWWLPATAAASALAVAYAFVLPVVIEPIFNTFEPIEQTKWASLEPRFRDIVRRAGVEVDEVMVVDASRQGHHSNAYFTGFGATRRIVLYDNLLAKFTPAEVETILAHEVGHWYHDHIVLGIAMATGGALVAFILVACMLLWARGRGKLCLTSPSDPAALFLLLLLYVVGQWLAAPVQNAVSRHFERQADAASLKWAKQPDAFIAAEIRLAKENLINVAPLPFNVWLFASHPPVVDRIQMALDWQKENETADARR
ncbi:MAG: M48 family metalloprotease [Gemmataceae bacterium]|nr:M48 family metalloprotease [Gemmataceae bacterium]MCI0742391.1 M48 family metalloprotease [Gemmataceae bacterium]